jgi:hypothetical protein
MLTNIPDGTLLYMLAPKCEYKGAPEPQRLESITLHNKWDDITFTVGSRKDIHLKHLVNYYAKYVSPINGFFMKDNNSLELLFIADDELHKGRSLKDLEADRLEDRDFDEDYNCEWCAPRACCCGCRTYEEEEEEEKKPLSIAPPPPARLVPVQLDVAALLARLEALERSIALKVPA